MRRIALLAAFIFAAPLLFSGAAAARPPQQKWKPLFNGKDLTGWKHVGPGEMTVADGLIQTQIGRAHV